MTALLPAAHVARTYLEDVTVGECVDTPSLTVTAAHVGLYESLTGDLAARAGAVPDLLPLCLSTGLGWRVPHAPLAVLAFMGIEWHVVRAAEVGDTVFCRSRTLAKRVLRDGGVVVREQQIIDQRGQVVQHGKFTFLVAKRSA